MEKTVIEEVLPQLYRAEIPLPQNPLKATNSYILRGKERHLIIDTGMNREECRSAMAAVIRELDLDLAQTDFFITHLHADHLGLVGELATPTSRVYFNGPDAAVAADRDLWRKMPSITGRHGFPAALLEEAVKKHPGNRYSPRKMPDLELVKEGTVITVGDFTLRCVETPGHTWGHTCLYETRRRLFFSGDHILTDITPNISSWSDDENPLGDYLASLDKVCRMDIELLLPGHRSASLDCRGRIEELKEHHRHRLAEVLRILQDHGPGSAYRVASLMEWDIVADNWESFPLMQKWFATGEAVAHLRYLEEEGAVQREETDGVVIFRAS